MFRSILYCIYSQAALLGERPPDTHAPAAAARDKNRVRSADLEGATSRQCPAVPGQLMPRSGETCREDAASVPGSFVEARS